ncbi:MAG: hypothetical protein JRN52_04855 [Nitrososphaerota archaeon]|nr:hypothetical protein [Nitrososphaerota archaeon]
MNEDSSRRRTSRKPPSRRSIITFFVVGGILLVFPLALVVTTNPMCGADSSTLCSTPAYKFGLSFFPYLMLAGGLIIGYNMKRVSDSLKPLESAPDTGVESES